MNSQMIIFVNLLHEVSLTKHLNVALDCDVTCSLNIDVLVLNDNFIIRTDNFCYTITVGLYLIKCSSAVILMNTFAALSVVYFNDMPRFGYRHMIIWVSRGLTTSWKGFAPCVGYDLFIFIEFWIFVFVLVFANFGYLMTRCN